MNCDDCLKQLAEKKSSQRSLLTRLGDACMAHGYELWMRPGGDASIEVLALPVGPNYGSAQDVVNVFRELGNAPLPVSPARKRFQRARDTAIVPDVTTPGRQKWRIQGQPDIVLHFKTA